MLNIPNWKASKSIRVYTRNSDFPFPFAPLTDPVQLFGIYYEQDGSLYVEHFAPADAIDYARVERGRGEGSGLASWHCRSPEPMARLLRVELAAGLHHVTARGAG